MRGANLRQRAVTCQEVVVAAERGVRHHRHVVLLAPWQHVTLDVTIVETVRDLVGRAALSVRYTEQIFHLTYIEIGYAPGANLPRCTELLECGHDMGELCAGHGRMQQIEIEIAGAEPSEARLASPRDAVP